jgi:hypothetical protein
MCNLKRKFVARPVFFVPFAIPSRSSRLKAFDRKDRKDLSRRTTKTVLKDEENRLAGRRSLNLAAQKS